MFLPLTIITREANLLEENMPKSIKDFFFGCYLNLKIHQIFYPKIFHILNKINLIFS